MKKPSKIIVLALALTGGTLALTAQDPGNPPEGGPPPHEGGPGGPEGPGPGRPGHRPPPPIIAALDANHDGVIDEQEIANASVALKKLDKNGDGKLTMDELRPPLPPPGQRGPGRPGLRPRPGESSGNDEQEPPPRRETDQ